MTEATGQMADLTSHHIEGITREGSIQFSCPLFSQIVENLWMGGCPRGDAPQFNTIISLYDGEPYHVYGGQTLVQAKMLDSHDVPDSTQIAQLVAFVAVSVEVGPTLIHCQAGLNRSGLVAAAYLIAARDVAPAAAIAHLRERRSPAVLCNKAFEAFLLGLA